MFSQTLYALAFVAFGAVVNAQDRLPSGIYSIRTNVGFAHSNGGDINPVTVVGAGRPTINELWNVTQFEDGYVLRNVGSGSYAYSTGDDSSPVFSHVNLQTNWVIDPAGPGLWSIQYPDSDLMWTASDGPGQIVEVAADQGMIEQRWQFTRA